MSQIINYSHFLVEKIHYLCLEPLEIFKFIPVIKNILKI